MGRLKTVVSGLILFAAGYGTATLNGFAPSQIEATQDAAGTGQLSEDALKAYKKVSKAIKELNNLYVASGESTSAFDGVNFFAASVGGINAERDLEEGRGVDPETQERAGSHAVQDQHEVVVGVARVLPDIDDGDNVLAPRDRRAEG